MANRSTRRVIPIKVEPPSSLSREEHAAVLRDRVRRLLDGKAARLQVWAALPSLSDEVERPRDLLRRRGIDPQDGVA